MYCSLDDHHSVPLLEINDVAYKLNEDGIRGKVASNIRSATLNYDGCPLFVTNLYNLEAIFNLIYLGSVLKTQQELHENFYPKCDQYLMARHNMPSKQKPNWINSCKMAYYLVIFLEMTEFFDIGGCKVTSSPIQYVSQNQQNPLLDTQCCNYYYQISFFAVYPTEKNQISKNAFISFIRRFLFLCLWWLTYQGRKHPIFSVGFAINLALHFGY